MLYLDSSALVKRYIEEAGSAELNERHGRRERLGNVPDRLRRDR